MRAIPAALPGASMEYRPNAEGRTSGGRTCLRSVIDPAHFPVRGGRSYPAGVVRSYTVVPPIVVWLKFC